MSNIAHRNAVAENGENDIVPSSPEKHLTPHSEEKYEFPTSADRETDGDGSHSSGVSSGLTQGGVGHAMNAAGNPFAGQGLAKESSMAAETEHHAHRTAHINQQNVPIKQPSKSTNGS